MKTKPLNNNVLIEVTREFAGVSRTDENENMSYGILRDFSMGNYHLTASSGFRIDDKDLKILRKQLEAMIGHTVRWEEFAEGGQTFEEDGKTYALIPWWRLISITED